MRAGRACRLLAGLGRDDRIRMLTMPCDVGRLIRRRLGPHGDACVATAATRWADEPTLPAPVGEPLDARLFLGDWPYRALVDAPEAAPVPVVGDPLPQTRGPVLDALAALAAIDRVATAMLIESLRAAFDPALYRAALAESDLALADRLALALFRFLCLRLGALGELADPIERASLTARYFRAGDPSEIAALKAARAALEGTEVSLPALRGAVQTGARRCLDRLAADARYGVVLGGPALQAIEHALRLGPAWDEIDIAPDFAAPVVALAARELAVEGPVGESAHTAAENDDARLVEHLLVCADLRCVERVRDEACGKVAAFRQLSGPLSEPPPPSNFGQRTPHMIRCRDVLWQTFATMAQAEGRGVDDLVEEAMDRYRALRSHLDTGSPSGVGEEGGTSAAGKSGEEEEITRPR